MSGAPSETQAVFVRSTLDGRTFKMLMQGDLGNLSVEKIKRYLFRSTNIPPEEQSLTYEDRVLSSQMVGVDFGLRPNATLFLSRRDESGDAGRVGEMQAPHHQEHKYGAPSTELPSQQQSTPGKGSYPSPPHPTGLAPDTVGRQRQLESETREREASYRHPLGSEVRPTNLAADSLFERASRMQRMTSPPQNSARGGGPPTDGSVHNQSTHRPDDLMSGTAGAGSVSSQPQAGTGMMTDTHPLATKLVALEGENEALKAEIDRLRRQEVVASQLKPTTQDQLLTHAKAQLSELGKELGMHLSFDANFTCVVGSDERNTIIVTCDIPTERLYIYSTLCTSIPEDPALKLRLYEVLLEGSMLGRDMAGGGCGATLSTGLVMMSTSIDLRHSDVTALRETAPIFVESLVRWRNTIADLLVS